VKAFRRLGLEVKAINYRKLERLWGKNLTGRYILSCFHRFQPQFVFINSVDIPFGVLSQLSGKTKIGIYYPDYTDPFKEELAERGKLSDYFFISNQGQIPYLKERGVNNPIYMTEGCDNEVHRIIKSARKIWQSEVAFIGRPSDHYRVQLLWEVRKNFRLKVWGGDWEKHGFSCLKKNVYPPDYAKICSGSKIMLGIDVTDQVQGYFSNRTWITLGCGGFLLTRYTPGLEEIFVNEKHLVWYRNMEECLALISDYLNKDHERQSIAEEGYRFVHQHHTLNHLVERMLTHISNEG